MRSFFEWQLEKKVGEDFIGYRLFPAKVGCELRHNKTKIQKDCCKQYELCYTQLNRFTFFSLLAAFVYMRAYMSVSKCLCVCVCVWYK